jgi:hypothetical protein
MIVFFVPLKYLGLVNERGTRLFIRDLLPVLLMTAAFSAPFLVFPDVNLMRPSGFIDRMGSLASVLAGFYIAALVAVATFSSSLGDLDDKIEVGKILVRSSGEELTRREYVCAIFGFLSFLALLLSVVSAFSVIVAPTLKSILADRTITVRDVSIGFEAVARSAGAILYTMLLSLMIVTTFHGLYYLMDRIYAKAPRIMPKGE